MKLRQSISTLLAKLALCLFVAAGLALVGCGNDTIQEKSAEAKAEQDKYLSQDADLGTKNKAGKSVGPTIKAKSIKQMIREKSTTKE